MAKNISKAKKQLKSAFKDVSGVTIKKRKKAKFTEDQKRRIRKAQRQLRGK